MVNISQFLFQMFLLPFIIILPFLSFCSGWVVYIDNYQSVCFYEKVEKNDKVGLTFQVVDGGFLDIDLTIHGPDNREIYMATRETNGKYTFASYETGNYRFCFSNEMSTMTPKRVMFDVLVGPAKEWRSEDPDSLPNQGEKLQGMMMELGEALKGVQKEQEYITVRNMLHLRISEHTNDIVGKWTFFELLLIILGTLFEIWYLKRFFEIQRML